MKVKLNPRPEPFDDFVFAYMLGKFVHVGSSGKLPLFEVLSKSQYNDYYASLGGRVAQEVLKNGVFQVRWDRNELENLQSLRLDDRERAAAKIRREMRGRR